jgi:spermidine synthase
MGVREVLLSLTYLNISLLFLQMDLFEIGNKKSNIVWIRITIYTCFFFSGFASLIFEILWSRQFVTVFGNSSYAISVVLSAYMAGIGLGGIFGGRLADRAKNRAGIYAVILTLISIWALFIPLMLDSLRTAVPGLALLTTDYLLLSMITRFILSFAILGVPCFLMGMTLPLLVRMVTESGTYIGMRISMLYALNTLGAAFGCFAAGIWMMDTLGLGNMNLVAVGINVVLAIVVLVLWKPINILSGLALTGTDKAKSLPEEGKVLHPEREVPGWFFLVVAFFNGVVGLSVEILWMRYLSFLASVAYVFPVLLSIYLLGIGLGSLIYRMFAVKIKHPIKVLGLLEVLLALSIPATFVISAYMYTTGSPSPVDFRVMAFVVMFVPTVLMGIAFPLLCSLYGRSLRTLGRNIGKLYAINTAGTVAGSLLPVFVLIPTLGIQRSFLFVSLICGVIGIFLLTYGREKKQWLKLGLAAVYTLALVVFFMVPSNLCQRVFMSTSFYLSKHTDILFYREGRTGTAIVTRDKINNCRTVYINGVSEVPLLYTTQLCFKMIGDLGPMLHPNPDEVLMICFGGGIAAGATTCLPEVKSLTVVDMEKSVVEAARLFNEENNNLLENPIAKVVIDDGRNYLLMSRRKWQVIVSDATHPKSSDSWVLYTEEFYNIVRERLTGKGVFVQWVPMHNLSTAEFKIIVRTFQSVFPNVGLWIVHGVEERATFSSYALLVATPSPLEINSDDLRERLNVERVREDLRPYGLHNLSGFLNTFLCAGDRLRRWVGMGPVNTDNLPYTHYETYYSRGPMLMDAELIELMEDIWPYLTNTGSKKEAEQLREELNLYAEVNRLALLGRLSEAYALFPDDIRCRKMRSIYEEWPDYIQKLVNIYWEDPIALMMIAGSLPGSIKSAVNICKRVLELDSDNVEALNLRKAINLGPACAEAQYNLSLLLEITGREGEAFQHLQKAALYSDVEYPPVKLGLYFAKKKCFREAIPWFRRAIEINPMSIQSRIYLAVALLSTDQIPEVLKHVNYVLKVDPENEIALEILTEIEKQREPVDGYSIDTMKP